MRPDRLKERVVTFEARRVVIPTVLALPNASVTGLVLSISCSIRLIPEGRMFAALNVPLSQIPVPAPAGELHRLRLARSGLATYAHSLVAEV